MKEWLDSGMGFHIMRDHPEHDTPILGASWGSNMLDKFVRERWMNSWRKIFKSKYNWADRSQKGPDQQVLSR